MLHYAYNRRYEGDSEKDIEHQINSLNNIPLIKSYLKRCAVKNATQLIKENDNKQLIFGGKKNFIARCKGKITKDGFLNKRLSKLFIIGEANQHGNRMMVINEDLNYFTFKPTIKNKITLYIDGRYKRYKSILNKLYHLQKDKKKNIILPDVNDFHDRYVKSLEEFNIPGEIKDIVKIYNFLKNAKSRYRVSLDDLNHLEFSRCFSNKSNIKKILITIHKNT